jgi:hypothetical protein
MVLNEYLVIFLNNTAEIKNNKIKTYCQNLLQYWALEISVQVKVKVFTYMESALDFVENWSDHKHVVIIDIGNDLEVNGQFISKLIENINDDDVLVGHILDKQDRYYELHNQCFYFNADVWKSIGCPEYGHKEKKLLCNVPLRSKQNHHDDYTPYWIAPGTQEKLYTDLKQGYNFIKSFLDAGFTIKSFNKSIRDSKAYSYPYEIDDQFQNIIDFNFIKKYYLYNTEKQRLEQIPNKKIKRFATVCAGLNHLKVLKDKGFDSDTKLLFYDWDEFSVEMMKAIYYQWDGIDYENFVKDTATKLKYTGTIVEDCNREKEFFDFFGGEQQFQSWFAELRETVTFDFKHIDIMQYKENTFEKFFDAPGFKLFWLSNIFHYKPTSIIYNLEQRAKIQDRVITALPKEKNMFVFSDSCILDQSKIFSTLDYKEKIINAKQTQEEILV